MNSFSVHFQFRIGGLRRLLGGLGFLGLIATLCAQIPPTVVQHPAAVPVFLGGGVTFSVNATGDAPLTYQWYTGVQGDTSTPVAGATGSTLALGGLQSVQRFWVRVSNGTGSADSHSAVAIPWFPRAPTFSGPRILSGVEFVNGRYVVTGLEMSAVSTNGINWTTQSAGQSAGSLTGGRVAFGNNRYIVGKGNTSGSLYVSSDALHWDYQSALIGGIVNSVLFTGTRFVAGGSEGNGDGRLISSEDGVTWTSRSTVGYVEAIAQGGGTLVAVGSGTSSVVATSPDGITWTPQVSPTTKTFKGIAFGRGKFVALATSQAGIDVLLSPDGVTWTTLVLSNVPAGAFRGLAYGSGFFAAAIGRGLWLSEDGSTWSFTDNFFPAAVFGGALGYGPPGFLWVGDDNTVIQSAPLPATVAVTVNGSSLNPVVLSGQTATLTVSASDANATYQWYLGASGNISSPINGATAASYQTPALTQTGQYWVRVTLNGDTADSATMTVTVATAPAIGVQPVSADIYVGQSANFSVTATGIPAPSFQWYKGNSGDTSRPINGATSSTQSATATERVARYWVRVTNVAGSVDSEAAVLTPWHKRERFSAAWGIIFADGQYVGVAGNKVQTSTDCVTWTVRATVQPANLDPWNYFPDALLTDIARGAGTFVVVGGGGVFTSPDLETWTERSLPDFVRGHYEVGPRVDYFAGKFWIVAGGAIYTSVDGVAWAKISTGFASVFVNAIAYNGTRFVAVGQDGNFIGGILSSSDGVNWSKFDFGAHPSNPNSLLHDIVFANGRFVAVGFSGNIFTSLDGIAWNRTAVGENHYRSVAFGAGLFVAGYGGGSFTTSPDGLNWTNRTANPHLGMRNLSFVGGRFLASDPSGDYLQSSLDGLVWTIISGSPGRVESVAASNGRYVVRGTLVLNEWQVYSDDGVNWGAAATASAGLLGYTNGLFVSADTSNLGRIYTSTDASNWILRTVPGATESYSSFAYGNGVHLLMGNKTTARSVDGVTWTAQTMGFPDSNFVSLSFGQGLFVAVGEFGRIVTSPDGVTWTLRRNVPPPPYIGFVSVAFGEGRFVAVSPAIATVFTSEDGITWTERSFPSPLVSPYRVAYGGGRFACHTSVGIVVSEDGITWRTTGVAPYGNEQGLAYGPLGFYAPRIQSVADIAWVPSITSATTALGQFGVVFSHTVTTEDEQVSFAATGLPGGLSINASSGVISGTPTAAGTFPVGLSLTNSGGTGTATLTLTIAKANQTISFGALPNRIYGDAPFAVSATASSGLVPTLSILSGPATISGSTVTLTGLGTVVIRAAQAGNGNYNAALNVDRTFAVGTIPAGFDVAGYLSRYPDVAATFGTDWYGAWLYYLNTGIYNGEVYDELFRGEEYLGLYPELYAIFGTNLSGALLHWLNEGRIEGRLGRIPLEFSAAGYFARNPDVAAAVNSNLILGWQHFWAFGIYEGRAYDDEFRVFEYLALNSDLQAAFLSDWRGATLHWMRYGRTEGRLGRLPVIFDSTNYASLYPNVASVWGTAPTTLWQHFWLYGIDEGKVFDNEFRVDEYLALNPDIQALFGTNRRGALIHWVRYGRAEGRRGKNP